jgi:hypothetical protein
LQSADCGKWDELGLKPRLKALLAEEMLVLGFYVDLKVSLVVLAQVDRALLSEYGAAVEEEKTRLTSELFDSTRQSSHRILGFSCS